MTQIVWVAEVVAYDPNIAGTTTLYYATKGFASLSTDTPVSTHVDERLLEPMGVTRSMFASGSTRGRSTMGFGDVVLVNDDGGLDALKDYGFDGRSITIRRGIPGAAYPSAFTTELVATMHVPEFTQDRVILKLRDRQAEMVVPLQGTKFAGTGLGTLEGSTDLLGKPKPFCIGKVYNILPPCVETAKLIYQVHDGTVSSIDSVYDRGVSLASAFAWTGSQVDFAAANFTCFDIAYGVGLFVLIGGETTIGAGGTNMVIYTSPDGVFNNWTKRVSPFGTPSTSAKVRFANGVFIGTTGDGRTATSTDGITWTLRATGLPATTLSPAVYISSSGTWVIVGNTDSATSTDNGVNWTLHAAAVPSLGATNGMTYGNGVILAVGSGFATSRDGVTWASLTVPNISTSAGTDITFDTTLGLFVVVGTNGLVATSDTGVAWLVRDAGFASATVTAVASNGSLIVVTSTTPAYSYDGGATWSAGSSLPSAGTPAAIRYGNGIFLACSSLKTLDITTSDSYASSADLLDNTKAPPPGSFKVYSSSGGSYFRLGASPDGAVTCDATEGSTAADRTPAQLYKRLLVRSGKSAADYNAGDLTTLDAAANYVCGYWTAEETTYDVIFDWIGRSVWAAWYVDKTGDFRIKQLLAPSGSAAFSFVASDLLNIGKAIRRIRPNDPGQGLPSYQTVIRYQQNNTVQDVDLAAGVTDERRAFLRAQWREKKSTDTGVQTSNVLALQTVEETLLTSSTDASTEATRWQALRGHVPELYEIDVPLDSQTATIELHDVTEAVHSRYGLMIVGSESGSLFRCIGIATNAKDQTVRLTLWAPYQNTNNRITRDAEYRVTTAGEYRVTVSA